MGEGLGAWVAGLGVWGVGGVVKATLGVVLVVVMGVVVVWEVMVAGMATQASLGEGVMAVVVKAVGWVVAVVVPVRGVQVVTVMADLQEQKTLRLSMYGV